MQTFKYAWTGFLILIFIAFSLWYGGRTTPLTVEEGTALLNEITELHIEAGNPTGTDGFRQNMLDMIPKDDGREFYAINLESLKPGNEAREADAAYGRHVIPALLKRGSFPVYVGDRSGLMLGQYGEEIDRVAIVRYRSLRDMLEMNTDPAMIDGVPYKFASLDHTEVFISRPVVSAVQVKLLVGLTLVLLGIAGWYLPGLISRVKA
ncbi:MAG: hypothetical protein AAFS13_06140 [Pseudomonadota bacterium]